MFSLEYINAAISEDTIKTLCDEFRKNNRIDPEKFEKYKVKRGLRNADGSGVMAGLTLICNVHGYVINEGSVLRRRGTPHLPRRGYP